MLSPCPFCGTHNVRTASLELPDESRYRVVCLECHAQGPTSPTAPEAQERWNGERDPSYIISPPTMPPRHSWDAVVFRDRDVKVLLYIGVVMALITLLVWVFER